MKVSPALFVMATLAMACFALPGCQSTEAPNHTQTSSDTASGAGGGNGEFGSNPAKAMHGNPDDTQPAR